MEKFNFYKLRAKIIVEDLSEVLGVMAVWDNPGLSEYGLAYPDPRVPALGTRVMLPPHLTEEAASDLAAELASADDYDAHRIRGDFEALPACSRLQSARRYGLHVR